jgi:uncharacterized membrane protein
LLRPWLALAGDSEFGLRLLSSLFSVLVVALIFRLGRRLFSDLPSVGLIAALLAAASPYLVWYGQEGKMYALVTALVVAAVICYVAALSEGGWWRWLGFVLLCTAAMYVHLVAALIIPALALAFPLMGRQLVIRRWRPWLVSMAALTLPYVPLLVWQLPMLAGAGESGYRFVPLPDILLSMIGSYSLGVIQQPTPWLLVPFVALLLALALALRAGRSQRVATGILLSWLLVPIIGLFLVTLARPMYTARYLIFVLPAYLLLLAYSVVSIGQRSRLVAALLLAGVVAAGSWGMWLQATTPLKADFRGATRFVSARLEPEDLIIFQIPHGRHSFAYYYEPTQETASRESLDGYRTYLPFVAGGANVPFAWADGLYTNNGLSTAEVSQRMAEIVGDRPTVWLVSSEAEMWDNRRLVQAWLEGNYQEDLHTEFVRVVVQRFRLSRP